MELLRARRRGGGLGSEGALNLLAVRRRLERRMATWCVSASNATADVLAICVAIRRLGTKRLEG